MNVLITSAGRRVRLVELFQESAAGSVVVADRDHLAPALYSADRAEIVPSVDDPEYPDALMRIIRKQNIGLLVPTIDTELSLLAAHREELTEAGCLPAVSEQDFVTITFDKLLTFRTFRAHGISVPATWLPSQPADGPAADTIIEKPRWGSASRGVVVLENYRVGSSHHPRKDVVHQQLLEGVEITIDALLDLNGHVVNFIPRERIRVLAGESIQGRTIDDADIREWVIGVLEHCASLGARGVLTVQAFLTESGPVLLEINPRFGGGYPLSHAAGADYPRLLIDMAGGTDVAPRIGEYARNLYFTRFYADTIVKKPIG